MAYSLQNQVFLVRYFMNECSNVKLESAILSFVKLLYIFLNYSLQHEVFLASRYLAINFVYVWFNGKLCATENWHNN